MVDQLSSVMFVPLCSFICLLNLNIWLLDVSAHGLKSSIWLSVDYSQHLTDSRHQFLLMTFNHLVQHIIKFPLSSCCSFIEKFVEEGGLNVLPEG